MRLDTLVVASVLGTTLSLYFRKNEPNSYRCALAMLGLPMIALMANVVQGRPLLASCTEAFLFAGSTLASLLLNILAYRIGPWHPLAKFPGPSAAKVSKFWSVKVQVTGKKPQILKALHQKYGSIVRTGPNELSLDSLDAQRLIYGTAKKYWRGPLYRSLSPQGSSILAQRDPNDHKHRRTLWTNALSPKSLDEYTPRLNEHASHLISVLGKFAGEGQPIDLHQVFSFYTLDTAGSLAFSSASSFHLLSDLGDVEGHAVFLRHGAKLVQAMNQISWIYDILYKLPSSQGVEKFRSWARERVRQRLQAPSQTKDVFSHFSDSSAGRSRLSNADLAAEALIVLTAGSDTTLYTLTALFVNLLTTPTALSRVRLELVNALGSPAQPAAFVPAAQLPVSSIPFLQACIDETLRLHPPAPTTLQRLVPGPTGLVLPDGTYIPPGTAVSTSSWLLHRSESYFSQPDAFIPERWLGQPREGEKLEKEAYVPFAIGYTACPGRNLALDQVRSVAASVLWNFDVQLVTAEGHILAPERLQQAKKQWEEDSEEAFVMLSAPLRVKLSRYRV